MCYNIQYLEARAEAMEKRYGATIPEPVFRQLRLPIYMVSAFTHPKWTVITMEHPEVFSLMQWGLVPYWIKSREEADKIRVMTPNCVGETSFEKASFKHLIGRKRCLIPATGFFEWHTIGKNKYPHYIYLKSREAFAIAGIYDHWVDKSTGEYIDSFSLITTAANPLLEKIHNVKKRMPVILPREREREWLDPSLTKESILSLMQPYPQEEMTAHSISKLISSKTTNPDVPEVIAPFLYPELENFADSQ